MKNTALLVRRLLEHPETLSWSYQGFGMLRHYLSKDVRLHIWDPTSAVENVTLIHDHPWDFESSIVCGQIRNTLYRVEDDGEATHLQQKIRCGPGGCEVNNPSPVRLSTFSDALYGPDSSYKEPAEFLHSTAATPGTVTIVQRRFRNDTEHAQVCFPKGERWVSAEPRAATSEEIKRFTSLALGALRVVL